MPHPRYGPSLSLIGEGKGKGKLVICGGRAQDGKDFANSINCTIHGTMMSVTAYLIGCKIIQCIKEYYLILPKKVMKLM